MLTPEQQDLFDAAYVMPGVEGCQRLIRLYDQGLHDFRERLAEKEMVHRAIVYLADKLNALAKKTGVSPCPPSEKTFERLCKDEFLQKFDTKGGV